MESGKPYVTLDALKAFLVSNDLYSPLIQRALAQAVMSHGLHRRDDGTPYLEQHVYPMAVEICSYCEHDERERGVVTVLLHDVLEEDPLMSASHIESLFGSLVRVDVEQLTKKRFTSKERTQQVHHEEHMVFVDSLKHAPLLIQKIKLIDRINNLACTEMSRNKAQYERYLYDTESLYLPFALSVDAALATRIENEVIRLKSNY